MSQMTTAAEFDAYAANPRSYIAITDAAGTTVHKVSCRHVRRSHFGRYFAVASVREAYEQFALRAGIELGPRELWLLSRVDEREAVTEWELRHEFGEDADLVSSTLTALRDRSLVAGSDGVLRLTTEGSQVRERAHATRCRDLEELLDGWEPDRHVAIRTLVDELAGSFARELPQPA